MAINLSSTNHVIRVTTDGTEAIDVVAAYADWTSAAPFVPDSQETLITTATTTTIVSAPGASTVRMVNHISITNTSATSANVIVDVYDGSNNHECGTWDLAQDESLVFDGQTWQVLGETAFYTGFIAKATADQTNITNSTWQKAQFDDEIWDPHGDYDDVTNYRYTPTKGGLYLVHLQIRWGAVDDNKFCAAGIYKNGTLYAYAIKLSTGTDASADCVLTRLISFNGSTDYIEAYGYHENGDNTPDMNLNSDNVNEFFAVRVSA